MGIFIHLSIAHSVTKEEWKTVYEESLELAKKLPLAAIQEKKIHGYETVCLVPVEEHKIANLWSDESEMGWEASGDLEMLQSAETFYLSRNLIDEDTVVDPDAGDTEEFLPYMHEVLYQTDQRCGNMTYWQHMYQDFLMNLRERSYQIAIVTLDALTEPELWEEYPNPEEYKRWTVKMYLDLLSNQEMRKEILGF